MIDSNADYLETHHDRIPNFALHPTVTAVSDGNWSDVGTWSGGVAPTTGDIVLIPVGTTVTYEAQSSAAVEVVGVKGQLRFATDTDTKLTVVTLLVYPEGTLEIGTADAPIDAGVRAEVVIADQAFDLVADPAQWGHGIVAFGTVRVHGSELNETFVRLADEALLGDQTLQLEQAVSGWQVGDELYVPDTRHLRDFQQRQNYQSQGETRRIAGISPDGLTLTLDSALYYDHLGARGQDGNLDFTPHVGNFGRNILVRSENPLGVTGHVAFLFRADVDVRFAEFRDLGRTTVAPIDNTTFDGNGDVTHIGTNQIARYSLHAHHLLGPQTPQANGQQFTIVGNSLTWPGQGTANGANTKKWGIVLHASHYGLVQQNVLRDIADAGIVAEDGSESHNLFERNFVASGWSGKTLDQSGAFWFRGFNNSVRGNVAANMYTTNVHSGYGFTFSGRFLGNRNIPAFQGADPQVAGEFLAVDMNGTAIQEFRDNEAYASESGMTIWWLNQFGGSSANSRAAAKSVISNFSVWNVYRHGYFGYETHDVMFDDYTVRGDASLLSNVFEQNTGWYSNDYFTSRNVIRNADIQGMRTGIKCRPTTPPAW
ncbi:MAG: hypothetical protein O3A00_00145 [Planctomycetota bacterium]|nr:hypothetical protein [Planctomycetota bacterium]